ncbi:hypothetical protein PAXRUDRAFT_142010, partial [Paxillus rubicundulus Ve08.2h10]
PNGTNSPFDIESKITYEELCDLVALKLKCYSPALKLQYHLDLNNAKHAATSIQSKQELTLFMVRMCPMLVPPCLANGKPSARPLKNKKYTCKVHTKSSELPVYCFPGPNETSTPHLPLSLTQRLMLTQCLYYQLMTYPWLKSLDDHKERGKYGIRFVQFSSIFEQEGFLRLLQLSGEFISQNELQEMLKVPRGTTLLIQSKTYESWHWK